MTRAQQAAQAIAALGATPDVDVARRTLQEWDVRDQAAALISTAGSGGGLPTGWTVDSPDPGDMNANGGELEGVANLSTDGTGDVSLTGQTVTIAGTPDVAFNSPIQVGTLLAGNHTDPAIEIAGTGEVEIIGGDGSTGVVVVDPDFVAVRHPNGDDGITVDETTVTIAAESTAFQVVNPFAVFKADATGLGFFGHATAACPEVPATPDAQDVVDALVALGLITQAAP